MSEGKEHKETVRTLRARLLTTFSTSWRGNLSSSGAPTSFWYALKSFCTFLLVSRGAPSPRMSSSDGLSPLELSKPARTDEPAAAPVTLEMRPAAVRAPGPMELVSRSWRRGGTESSREKKDSS